MNKNTTAEWVIVGAGPAGIAAVGQLLDRGINPQHITWIDPHFNVGDFAAHWSNIPSNTKVGLFEKFLQTCRSFEFNKDDNWELCLQDPNNTCYLKLMTAPLKKVTEILKKKVNTITGKVEQIKKQGAWQLMTNQNETIHADNVILAIGAEPKTLSYPGVEIISLATAMDHDKLKQACCAKKDVVAVFGSSHSAILAIRNLSENGVKKIINFYQSPLKYAIYLEDFIVFDNTGLKGTTAEWARQNMDSHLPKNIERYYSSDENIYAHLPQCNKVIYAVGFESRSIPVEGLASLDYNQRLGIIAPGLFGLGIAFPEKRVDQFGNEEYYVGLWKFMDYLNRVMPIWLKYPA